MSGGTHGDRCLVLHYHLFKNAGSSVDEMLRRNFPGRWTSQEFNLPPRERAGAVAAFVQENEQADAISSHTALLPVPELENVRIFPVIFLRHPIDRLRSAYQFERMQDADTLGSRLAKAHDFAGYLREHLKVPGHRHVRNYQAYRLSLHCRGRKGQQAARALKAFRQLPFVGLVEEFEKSLIRLELLLRPWFPNFCAESLRRNTTSSGTTLTERLAWCRQSLDNALYEEVCEANSDDLLLHNAATEYWR